VWAIIPRATEKDAEKAVSAARSSTPATATTRRRSTGSTSLPGDHDRGRPQGPGLTFPIPTYNLSKEFDWDSPKARLLFEATAKYGIPYFQNYIGTNMNPGDIRAMCCRLNLDQRELMRRPGNIWGPGDSTGSIGVVTINLNRIGYESKTKEEYFSKLKDLMTLAKESLETKREVVNNMLAKGMMPYTLVYLGHFDNHFSTIGICGMNESCLNFLGQGIGSPEGKEFAIETLEFMRGVLREFQEETGNLYNLEATPAESTSYRLARKDKGKYKVCQKIYFRKIK
jgi:ribonucleoside-triphosphate reductase